MRNAELWEENKSDKRLRVEWFDWGTDVVTALKMPLQLLAGLTAGAGKLKC